MDEEKNAMQINFIYEISRSIFLLNLAMKISSVTKKFKYFPQYSTLHIVVISKKNRKEKSNKQMFRMKHSWEL